MNNNDHCSKEEFNKFVTNDFKHLRIEVHKLKRAVFFIKGELLVLIPLILMTFAAIITVLLMTIYN